jgi:uncharacterized SAM-binding protein YcdF (DUF218 family)
MRGSKSIYYRLGVLFLVLFTLFALRIHLLRALGSFLVCEDPLEPAEAIVTLAGSPAERGAEAARLFSAMPSSRVICTGELVPPVLRLVGAPHTEAALTARVVEKAGVPEANILIINQGTSTYEEAQHILSLCEGRGLKKIIILSSKFHTRRVRGTFRKIFKGSPVTLIIRGAPSLSYSEESWWKTENGLIMVTNEYMKLLYYFLYH